MANIEDVQNDDLVQGQKRLDLLYPGRYELKIIEEPEIMMVTLEIYLQSDLTHETVDVGMSPPREMPEFIFIK
jgi:hypothetical protein